MLYVRNREIEYETGRSRLAEWQLGGLGFSETCGITEETRTRGFAAPAFARCARRHLVSVDTLGVGTIRVNTHSSNEARTKLQIVGAWAP